MGISVRVLCDSAAGALLHSGSIGAVIVGADRIASNGDVANKIGTYSLAILARFHNVPFYVAAPFSSFDLTIASGKKIIIEQRKSTEVTCPMDIQVKRLLVGGVLVCRYFTACARLLLSESALTILLLTSLLQRSYIPSSRSAG